MSCLLEIVLPLVHMENVQPNLNKNCPEESQNTKQLT